MPRSPHRWESLDGCKVRHERQVTPLTPCAKLGVQALDLLPLRAKRGSGKEHGSDHVGFVLHGSGFTA